jgi:hypothetical protein
MENFDAASSAVMAQATPAKASSFLPAKSAPQLPIAAAEVIYGARETAESAAAFGERLYEPYTVQTIAIEAAQPHPTKLVQSAAMASVRPPLPSYRPLLPRALIEQGVLSTAENGRLFLRVRVFAQTRRLFGLEDGIASSFGRSRIMLFCPAVRSAQEAIPGWTPGAISQLR